MEIVNIFLLFPFFVVILQSQIVHRTFVNRKSSRDVAQPGRVHVWGARGRRFKSCHPDTK